MKVNNLGFKEKWIYITTLQCQHGKLDHINAKTNQSSIKYVCFKLFDRSLKVMPKALFTRDILAHNIAVNW